MGDNHADNGQRRRGEQCTNTDCQQLRIRFNGMTAHIRRLIEAQREMTRAVSHELRTPVARLRFGLEMLADCESADERPGRGGR